MLGIRLITAYLLELEIGSVISHSNTGAFPKVAGYAINPQGGPNLMGPIISVS